MPLGKPGEGKLWQPGCHAGPVSQVMASCHQRLKGQLDGDEHHCHAQLMDMHPTLPKDLGLVGLCICVKESAQD